LKYWGRRIMSFETSLGYVTILFQKERKRKQTSKNQGLNWKVKPKTMGKMTKPSVNFRSTWRLNGSS
jgi:hypothetical protein